MRKGLITVYILLGMIILLLLGSAIYVANKTLKRPSAKTAEEKPLKLYVEDCIRHLAEQGVVLLGKHGGYINPKDTDIAQKQLVIDKSPAEGDVFLPSPLSSSGIVYWTYLSTPNNCNNCVVSTKNVPTLPEISKQLERYVAKKLPECLNDFDIFIKKGYKIEQQGELKLNTFFTEEDVRIVANYPLTVRKKEIITRFSDFGTIVDVPFKRIYETAKEINQNLLEKALLEDHIIKLIGIYSGALPWKLPPLGETAQEKFAVTWMPMLAQFQIQQFLTVYTPTIVLNNTKNTPISEYMILDALSRKKPFYARVHYLGWPFYFDITPNTEGVLSPDIYKRRFPFDIIQPIQTNTYEFFYDLSVPFLVEIKDPNARKKEGYTFQFAVEANIRDNKNMLEWNEGEGTIGQWNPEKAELTAKLEDPRPGLCKSQTSDAKITYQCEYDNKIYADIQACAGNCTKPITVQKKIKPAKGFFCSANQRLSGTILFRIKDQKKQSVKDTSITYGCGTYAACNMGMTNERGILKTKLPICTGGYIIAEKDGHHKKVLPFATRPGQKHEENITLDAYKVMNISVKKYIMTYNATEKTMQCCKPAVKLGPFDKVLLTLQRVQEDNLASPLMHTVSFEASTKPQEITILEGNYTVMGQYIDNLGVVIPQGCMHLCTEFNPLTGACTKSKSLPDTTKIIKPAPLGGVLYSERSEYLEIKKQHIDTEKEVIFHVLQLPTINCLSSQDCILPNCIGMEELGKIGEYTIRYNQYVRPRFK